MTERPMAASAILSECGRYRYRLDRVWSDGPACCFIMLNPSTADAEKDDPTIRRCIGFAKRWSCGRLIVVNLFAFRATRPDELLQAENVTGGVESERQFHKATEEAHLLIAAWGAWQSRRFPNPGFFVVQRFRERLLCLGRTKDGHPRHPLYVPANAPLIPLVTP